MNKVLTLLSAAPPLHPGPYTTSAPRSLEEQVIFRRLHQEHGCCRRRCRARRRGSSVASACAADAQSRQGCLEGIERGYLAPYLPYVCARPVELSCGPLWPAVVGQSGPVGPVLFFVE